MPDWRKLEVNVITEESDNNWYGTVELTNLSPGTDYRVKVASKNKEGYSKFSKVHTFTTPKVHTFTSPVTGSLYLII